MPRPRRLDERGGWIDRRDRIRPEPGHELGGQRPRATADVERPLAGRDAGQVGELRREQPRVAAHEPVVRLGGDIEAHADRLLRGVAPDPERGLDLLELALDGLLALGLGRWLTLAGRAVGPVGAVPSSPDAPLSDSPAEAAAAW